MPISNFTQLKQAVSDFMARADVLGNAADFIALGEAGLNRELNPVEVDQSLSGTIGSRTVDVSSLAMVEPIALFITLTNGEASMLPRAVGTFTYGDISGAPAIWGVDGKTIVFDRPCDQAYPFRLRYRQKFALSDAAPTNWLLTEHPDVYLAASIVWGGVFIQDGNYASSFKAVLDDTIPKVRGTIAQSKRGVLTVDPALSAFNRYDGRDYL